MRPSLSEGLTERGSLLLTQSLHPIGKPHRLHDVTRPILRRSQFIGDGPSGKVGDKAKPWRMIGDLGSDSRELFQHGLHEG